MALAWTGLLMVLLSSLCHGRSRQELIKIAGPLRSSSGGANPYDVLDCHNADVEEMKGQISVLQKYGVNHYKILLDKSSMIKDDFQVLCYRNLLKVLIKAGIRPLVVLNSGDELPIHRTANMYVDYADFAFRTFGDLVYTWITFEIPKLMTTNYIQDLLQEHMKVAELYHGKYSTMGEAS